MSDNSQTIAINEAELDKHMLDVIECGNKIKAIFNKIDDEIARVKPNYQCASATTLFSKYEQLNDNYSIMVDNIMSYNSDLMSLKKRFKSTSDDLANQVSADASSLEANGPEEYKEKR